MDYRVVRTLATLPWPYPKGGVLTFFQKDVIPHQGNDTWLWVITEKQAPEEAIGCVHLWRKGNPSNRGFWLAHKHWGNRYMTEAVEPVNDYAFTILGFDRLLLSNAVGNDASHKIKESNGARFIRREPAKFVDPSLTERELWELTRDDWFAHKKKLASLQQL